MAAEGTVKPHSSLRVMITGATGLLGRALVRAFHDYHLLAVALDRVKETSPSFYQKCDLTNVEETEKTVRDFHPDVIIHAAAERRTDVAEQNKERTEKLNVGSVRTLARLSQEVGAFLLLISTDYVFDGFRPPHKTNSKRNPLNYYGDTKSRAEEVLWESEHKGGVLRVPLLYGRVEYVDECFLTQMIRQILIHSENVKNGSDGTEGPVQLDTWQVRSPTLVDDVAVACVKLVERRMRHCSLTGTWQFSANRKMTKYDIGLEIVKALGLSETLIEGKEFVDEKKPKDATLDATALYLMGIGTSTTFSEGLKIILDDLRHRPDLGITLP